MLTDDSPERDLDPFDSEGLPAATPPVEHEESTSNLSQSEPISNRLNPTENPRSSQKPRREVRWLDLDAANLSLELIGRRFEDRLNRSELSSSNSLLDHIRSPNGVNRGGILHQCPGYLREEITLTCDLSKSVIVSHAFPDPSERCSICHQLVPCTPMVSDHAALTFVANYVVNHKNFIFNDCTFVSHVFMQAADTEFKLEGNPFVSCLHYLFSAFVDDLQTQVSGSGFFTGYKNMIITNASLVNHYHYPHDYNMQVARESEGIKSVSSLHFLFSAFHWESG